MKPGPEDASPHRLSQQRFTELASFLETSCGIRLAPQKRLMVESEHPALSVRRQCELLDLARSGLYYEPRGESAENLHLCRLIDEAYTRWPFYGVPRMTAWLRREGHTVNPKRVRRLMRLMGLEAIYAKPRLSASGKPHKRYPYLLRDVVVDHADQVWSADITYIRLRGGFLYLVAVMDWHSRCVLWWELSSSLESDFCVRALKEALARGRPEVFNTDQGVQFTSEVFTSVLEGRKIAISMDGRGRAFDNIFSERLWRTVKYEEVYLKDYADEAEARRELRRYFRFYNQERLHQALDYHTPAEVYEGRWGETGDRTSAVTVAVTPVALRAPSVTATVPV
jgi:putative transposase